MSTLLFIIGLIFLASGLAASITQEIRDANAKAARAWTVACDGKGSYSYYDQDGDLRSDEFPSYEAAERWMLDRKAEHEKSAPFDWAAYKAREARFTACKQ